MTVAELTYRMFERMVVIDPLDDRVEYRVEQLKLWSTLRGRPQLQPRRKRRRRNSTTYTQKLNPKDCIDPLCSIAEGIAAAATVHGKLKRAGCFPRRRRRPILTHERESSVAKPTASSYIHHRMFSITAFSIAMFSIAVIVRGESKRAGSFPRQRLST